MTATTEQFKQPIMSETLKPSVIEMIILNEENKVSTPITKTPVMLKTPHHNHNNTLIVSHHHQRPTKDHLTLVECFYVVLTIHQLYIPIKHTPNMFL